MECAVITTYRCNARCQMCNSWKSPSKPSEEFDPKILEKIPGGMKRLNITGGEPLLRQDLLKIVEILRKKTGRLEISTNGYFTDKIIDIARKFPDITIRISVEGLPEKNDMLRGIKNGFDHALRTLLELKNLGVKDIGFAIVISHNNISELLTLYELTAGLDVEFSQSTMHNSFYFHKFYLKYLFKNPDLLPVIKKGDHEKGSESSSGLFVSLFLLEPSVFIIYIPQFPFLFD